MPVPLTYQLFKGYVRLVSKNHLQQSFQITGADMMKQLKESRISRTGYDSRKDTIDDILTTLTLTPVWSDYETGDLIFRGYYPEDDALSYIKWVLYGWGGYAIRSTQDGYIEFYKTMPKVATVFDFADEDIVLFDDLTTNCIGLNNIVNSIYIRNDEVDLYIRVFWQRSIDKYGLRQGEEISDIKIESQDSAIRLGQSIIFESHRIWEIRWNMPFVPNLNNGNTVSINSTNLGFYAKGVIRETSISLDILSGAIISSVYLKCMRKIRT